MQLLFTVLQTTVHAADSAKKVADKAAGIAADHVSAPILEIMIKGGVVMIILAVCLLIAIFFAIERFIYISNRTKLDHNLMNIVRDNLKEGKHESALTYCERTPTTQAQVVATGLRFLGSNMREIESAMETRANVELSAMESHLSYLSLIARIAPMLGFVGTIWGVINIFYSIAQDSNLSIGGISEGLYTKMVASFGGLLVGIIAFVMYHLLLKRIDRFAERIQEQSLTFLEMLNKTNV